MGVLLGDQVYGAGRGDAPEQSELAHGGNVSHPWMAPDVAVAQDPAGNLKPQ
jgi:hypothetical protein